MENQKFQFKTNINCSGCVATVKPHLDQATGIQEWNVDTTDQNKILTVTTANLTEEQVLGIVRQAGFKAEPV